MSNRLQLTQLAASIALVAGSAAFVSSAHAAAPAAGTNISNVASATYTDSTGNPKTVSSNIVTTTVLPVASFTLEANRTATANNNSLVSLSHTLTNTGNGRDTFTLSLDNVANKPAADGDDYDFTGLKIYLDANGDGIPDSTTPITSITLDAGKSVNLIVQGTTDATAAVDKLGQWIVGATSTNTTLAGTAMTVTNTDTVKITNGAVIKVTKSASVNNIDATKADKDDRIVTYTLEYQNIGNSAANGLKLTDVLDAKLEYKPGSAKLLGTEQTDAADGDGYVFDTNTNTLTLNITSLAPNNKGTLTFQAFVKQGTDVGAIENTAKSQIGTDTPEPSNTNYVNVIAVPKGTINDNVSDAYSDAEKDLGDTAKDNQIIINEINQGEVAVFGGAVTEKIIIHNTGNVAQEFNVSATNISLSGGGTGIVTLYQADGVTPFVSTGTLAKGGTKGDTYELVAKITLPATYSGNSPLTATLITSPKSDSTKTDTLNLVIKNVVAATVDLHNGDTNIAGGTGTGVGTGKDAGQYVDTRSVLPGQSATFPLQVDNLGAVSDNFNLSHNLPAGWDVKFYIADAAGTGSTGSPITNTGNINASTGSPTQTDNKLKLVAVVTPPAGTTAGDVDARFTVTSPATNLSDTMSDKLTVQADRKLSLQNDRIGQVAPGGTVVYKHTLTNNSNLVEGATAAGIPFSLTSSNTDWAASLYIDKNNDGLIDANDTLVTGTALTFSGNAGIAKGASVNLLVKVQAPINATVGTQNPVVLTFNPVDYNGISHDPLKNTDLTTVTAGQVRLVKDQYLANCADGKAINGTGTGTETYTQATVSAKPGECVKYRITAINEGNATVTNVVISDTTPQYTTLAAIAGVSPKATDATLGGISSNGSTGTITATQPSLEATKKAELEFVIKVNPLTP